MVVEGDHLHTHVERYTLRWPQKCAISARPNNRPRNVKSNKFRHFSLVLLNRNSKLLESIWKEIILSLARSSMHRLLAMVCVRNAFNLIFHWVLLLLIAWNAWCASSIANFNIRIYSCLPYLMSQYLSASVLVCVYFSPPLFFFFSPIIIFFGMFCVWNICAGAKPFSH